MNGQIPEWLPELIRGCLCIVNKFYVHLSAWRIKKTKGNGINDSPVRWLCVYAVVFWMPRFPRAILHVYFIFLNGLWQLKFTLVVTQLIVGYENGIDAH